MEQRHDGPLRVWSPWWRRQEEENELAVNCLAAAVRQSKLLCCWVCLASSSHSSLLHSRLAKPGRRPSSDNNAAFKRGQQGSMEKIWAAIRWIALRLTGSAPLAASGATLGSTCTACSLNIKLYDGPSNYREIEEKLELNLLNLYRRFRNMLKRQIPIVFFCNSLTLFISIANSIFYFC